MINVNAFRRNWLKYHKAYEKKGYKIIHDYLLQMGNDIPFDRLTYGNYEILIEASINNEAMTLAYIDMYEAIGIANGKRIGSLINKDVKNFVLDAFTQEYRKNLVQWVLENVGTRIVSVRGTYVEYIKQIIAKGIEDEKTIVQIAKELKELINKPNFYRWQALRIARTETTTAANRGAVEAGENSRLVYEKVWISAQDSRVRTNPPSQYDHKEMNGRRVDKDQPFNVNGELIMYAGAALTVNDNPSHGANVINCRCANLIVVKRDSNGRPIRID